jgi:class 3 adenylate cyclase
MSRCARPASRATGPCRRARSSAGARALAETTAAASAAGEATCRRILELADYDRLVPELPAGTVTFVFTDIEDSTELLKRLGDDYREVLTGHRRIVRDSFAARDGVEMDTQGDAFFFVFARARDALSAAVDAQRAHAAAEWPAEVAVRVRIGLHTGEPAIHEEGYVGLDVVRAARICTVGRGGQILLSETTRALVGSGLPEGVTVFPLGQRQLRGIDEPERVYEVAIDGLELEGAEPPVRAASPTPTAAAPSDQLERDVAQRFEGLGARLAAGIEERVLHALEGTVDRVGKTQSEPGSVDEIASRMASLGDEIDARVRAALAKKGKGPKGS